MPLPLIPILWTVGTAVASAIVNRTRKTKLKIAVIGPEEGGKTAFINLLKNGTVKKDEPYRNTGLNEALLEFEAFWSVENSVLRTDIAVNSEAGLWEKIKDFVPGEQHGGKVLRRITKNCLKERIFHFSFLISNATLTKKNTKRM